MWSRVSSLLGGSACLAPRLIRLGLCSSRRGVFSLPPPPESTFRASDLVFSKTESPKRKPAPEGLLFGVEFSDHMFEVDWSKEKGWENPRITPYHMLEMAPSCSSLHYAIQCFEGMKAYVDGDGVPRLFRPNMNMDRFRFSCRRLGLPDFNGDELLECIKELIRVEKDWIPKLDGYSLYIRPTAISTDSTLGVAPARKCKIFVILSPVGPYYKSGFSAVKLWASSKFVRAWPGGSGDSKLGSNYAPTLYPQQLAAAAGCSQVMWLFGEDHKISEVGTMNMFFFIRHSNGEKELATAPLDGTILPGVTRDSILSMAREWKEFRVSERYVTMNEFISRQAAGEIVEAFGCGTAAIVSPVKAILFEDKEYAIPLDPSDSDAGIGPLAKRIAVHLKDIQYGRVEHEWSIRL